ncbi:hypothetical protein C5167_032604 [Papaver somniferum]|uniref:Brix domain-containing protein n=1 Tax=Papaver somniferum TaxID=3469 RepID=A0A4Y7K9H0_PAPSO|nr:hypothetical protein C5167_032604 [Papaver somniferum]
MELGEELPPRPTPHTIENRRQGCLMKSFVSPMMKRKETKPLDGKGKNKETKEKKLGKVITRLQECGPRFTLKLISLQHGTFDTKGGEYERLHKPEMDTSRRGFFL